MIASRVAFGVALAVFVLLAGCGQKGPLYMPGDEQAAEQYDPAGAHDPADASQEQRAAQSRTEGTADSADDEAATANGDATTREAGE